MSTETFSLTWQRKNNGPLKCKLNVSLSGRGLRYRFPSVNLKAGRGFYSIGLIESLITHSEAYIELKKKLDGPGK